MIYLISLTVSNILMMGTALWMTIFGISLTTGYHMTRLSFISSWLYYFPVTVTGIGVIMCVLAVVGILATITRCKSVLIVYSVCVAILVFPQFFSTYAASRLKQEIDDGAFERNNRKLQIYIEEGSEEELENWYHIQRNLRSFHKQIIEN